MVENQKDIRGIQQRIRLGGLWDGIRPRGSDRLDKVDGVVWRASAGEDIEEGVEVSIEKVHSSILLVSKQGGEQL